MAHTYCIKLGTGYIRYILRTIIPANTKFETGRTSFSLIYMVIKLHITIPVTERANDLKKGDHLRSFALTVHVSHKPTTGSKGEKEIEGYPFTFVGQQRNKYM